MQPAAKRWNSETVVTELGRVSVGKLGEELLDQIWFQKCIYCYFLLEKRLDLCNCLDLGIEYNFFSLFD